MRSNWLILILFLTVVTLIALFQIVPDESATVPPPATQPVEADAFRGFALQLATGWAEHPHEQYIREIADSGANSVSFIIHAFQEHGASESIFVDVRKAPSDRRLLELIAFAHEQNLRVALIPVVLLAKPRGGEWRGKIEPDNWDAWWVEYRRYILHYARIAQQGRAELFSVGSELVSTETQTERWRTLIADVRDIYPGLLTYSANWDHYRVPEYWDALDIIGMTTYHKLTEDQTAPSRDDLLAAWADIRENIRQWRETIQRPLLFTEVGWPNLTTCAQMPWDYTLTDKDPDPDLQALCFETFFETWASRPDVAGYFVWEWRNHPDQVIGPEDRSYCPLGKPAMTVIQNYITRPDPASRPTGETP
jgi:hypothetical protein